MGQPEPSPEFEALLHYLKHHRGCDLTGYKRSTLMRRFGHRMRHINIDSYGGYLQHLQRHAEEHLALLNDVLINFTAFFRDTHAWAYLVSEIIPQIIARKQADEPIRIWSAGCSTGQEICSLLTLLAEQLGVEFCLKRVQCHATDADADALQQAQRACYNPLEITSFSPHLLEKYFEQTEQGYVFHRELHRLVTFEQHDLMKDKPLSAIDLLICRNVLMYFTSEAQESILINFRSALNKTGFLFLGQAEMIVHNRQIFRSVGLKQRIYTKNFRSCWKN